jgi:hypothetical protein
VRLRKAWIEAAGKNYGANRMNAPLRVQQRLYQRWLAIPDEHRDAASEAGRAWWDRKIMKGPGVDW